jgi:hypothetical protein
MPCVRNRPPFSRRALTSAALVAGCFGLFVASTPAQTRNPDRDAYFGETHVHTSWSLDAWLGGNRTDPGDAYRYFKGEPIKHPLGYDVKIDTPLRTGPESLTIPSTLG